MDKLPNSTTVAVASILAILLVFGIYATLCFIVVVICVLATIPSYRTRMLASPAFALVYPELPPVTQTYPFTPPMHYHPRQSPGASLKRRDANFAHLNNVGYPTMNSKSIPPNVGCHATNSKSVSPNNVGYHTPNSKSPRESRAQFPKPTLLSPGQFPVVCLRPKQLPMLTNTNMICKPAIVHLAPPKDRFMMPRCRKQSPPQHLSQLGKPENLSPRKNYVNSRIVESNTTTKVRLSPPQPSTPNSRFTVVSSNQMMAFPMQQQPINNYVRKRHPDVITNVIGPKKFRTNEIDASYSSSRRAKRKSRKRNNIQSTPPQFSVDEPTVKIPKKEIMMRQTSPMEVPNELNESTQYINVSPNSFRHDPESPLKLLKQSLLPRRLSFSSGFQDKPITPVQPPSPPSIIKPKVSPRMDDIRRDQQATQARLKKLLQGVREAFDEKDRKIRLLSASATDVTAQEKPKQPALKQITKIPAQEFSLFKNQIVSTETTSTITTTNAVTSAATALVSSSPSSTCSTSTTSVGANMSKGGGLLSNGNSVSNSSIDTTALLSFANSSPLNTWPSTTFTSNAQIGSTPPSTNGGFSFGAPTQQMSIGAVPTSKRNVTNASKDLLQRLTASTSWTTPALSNSNGVNVSQPVPTNFLSSSIVAPVPTFSTVPTFSSFSTTGKTSSSPSNLFTFGLTGGDGDAKKVNSVPSTVMFQLGSPKTKAGSVPNTQNIAFPFVDSTSANFFAVPPVNKPVAESRQFKLSVGNGSM